MRKIFLTMAVMALFAIGFAASDDTDSLTSNETTKVQKVQEEQEVQKPKKNPKEKFAGTYVVYDDMHSGNEVFVTEDGRLFYKNDDGSAVKCGDIRVISDDAFEVLLGRDLYCSNDLVYTYKNGHKMTRAAYIHYMLTVVFDLSEKRLYVDGGEYENRDYSSPEYYKFRFTKK